jgi:cellulose synthase/poly-beta-1,6-N-acetylglucosamine synthase-like glycosyltransferase
VHLPSNPTDAEKYSYVRANRWPIMVSYCLGTAGLIFSLVALMHVNNVFLVLLPVLVLIVISSFCFISISVHVPPFDLNRHNTLVATSSSFAPSVDILLPVCNEEIPVLQNTWSGVAELVAAYPGIATPFVLDDGNRAETKALAERFGFRYSSRPNLRELKKAGNLLHGYQRSSSEYIAIFDADFRPRPDFLKETIPYFALEPQLGILQTPQFFDTSYDLDWLARSAGAVQEFFYRLAQPGRQARAEAICVGSNAVYRRTALDQNHGPTQIQHSEDVHTGFDLRALGWSIRYVPLNLAKGLCPSHAQAFFNQQYRWCMGSMSLLTMAKFWRRRPFPFFARVGYFSGFAYYIQTGVMIIFGPLIPVLILSLNPSIVRISNYWPLVPLFMFSYLVLPLWHRCHYGIANPSVRILIAWSHLIAIVGRITNRHLEWRPTGSSRDSSVHFKTMQIGLYSWTLPTSLAWTSLAVWHGVSRPIDFAPLIIAGLVALSSCSRLLWKVSR